MSRDKKVVSYNMSRIKSKDTTIEMLLRKELWSRGLRYRKNVKGIFGKPDIAFISKKIAIFCDSEFWHGFNWEVRKNDFKQNQEFWISKIESNIRRDIEVSEKLQQDGWLVLRFWGKDIKSNLADCANKIEKAWEER